MAKSISHVTVIGAGTMGAAIAGHLANAGIASHLLDIVPSELTAEESAKGLTLDSPAVRNRIVREGFERMVKSKPANLFSEQQAALISLGNLEDDFDAAVGQSDWIVEVIIERPGPKQALMGRIEAVAPAHAIISTNTSGIPVHIISQGRSAAFKKRFLGTHFFNPPRYLHLLEIIPTPDTDPAIVAQMKAFAETRLGKGVVVCKDTPNFVGNRMFSFIQSDVMEYAIENGYTVEEVDALTGPLIGRPKTATFRLNDVVGIDVAGLVGDNLYGLIPDDEDREVLRGPGGSAVMKLLIENRLLGSKTGQGFYKTVTDEKGRKSFWGLDLQAAASGTVDFVAPAKPRWASVGDAKDEELAERLRRLTDADDEAGDLLWHTLSPEIADSPADIDNAMKWGFGLEMGPFESWDALGVEDTLDRMEGEGVVAAGWVREMLASGRETFYVYENGQRTVYTPVDKASQAIGDPQAVTVADIRRRRGALAENDSASLLDMGDGVLLLEFHTKMNSLDTAIGEIANAAIERLHGSASGLVIGNQGGNFSAGANIFMIGMLAQSGQWEQLDGAIDGLQQMILQMRLAPKPVVAAPYQLALGGGAEISMGADRIVAHAETYMGLVEVGVGVIPGGGGCKEMVRRNVSPHMHAANVNPSPYLQQIFEQIGFAKVSTSAVEARQMGFFADTDRIVMNYDHLLGEAKAEVLRMGANGYTPPSVKGNVYAAGRDMLANLRIGIYSLKEGGYISEHDAIIAGQLATVLCGGELSQPAWMDEQYFLDLEREAFKTLCGYQKTQERIWAMLQSGKPLRN
ncbi:MAG TPA: 3-hydroxyacyl-CoA dehydrogenase NAD-binding domain-containing protein [Caldilineaceae bacterium]|nr:3-hydroxyacyl-CoA dehydrogenase NAD-binding domain-containing protein [Caldilineaceae bacterium]